MTRARRTKELAVRFAPVVACLLVTALIGSAFVRSVDLTPKVDEAFFFSPKDPELKVDREILAIFPESPQIIIAAQGDIRSAAYSERVRALSDALARQPGVKSVQSLSRGPKNLDDALKSPLWSRLLIPADHQSSYVFVTFSRAPDAAVVEQIEAIGRQYNDPAFRVMMSGVPFITTEIGRNLARDLRVFSLAALGVFGVVLLVIFRSPWILLGTLTACADSSATTLLATHWIHIPIGPLTANLSTMVFVMTLSPIVFLTFNWKRVHQERVEDQTMDGRAALRAAVARTVAPSFWSSVCMTLGFISLFLVPSTPMRHLGIAGAIGAAMAFVSAYVVYPWFLAQATASRSSRTATSGNTGWLTTFFSRRHGVIVAGLMALSVIGAYGLRYLNTDPALPSYFKPGGAIRTGLDAVDTSGGSSPLKFVVEDRQGAPLDTGDAYKRLWTLQDALERDPAVGTVVSLPVVLGEAKRRWYTIFVSDAHLIKVLDSAKHGEISRHLITADRTKALFLLRMRETTRTTSRQAVIDRLTHIVDQTGFRPVLVGGTYSLLDQQARLVTSSLISGVLLLVGVFVVMGYAFS
ncbi:MAG TPA: MMPL family transporter, partial [Vicinamibacterales bacterium]